jgi:vancomycin resistance protein YoaR
LAGSQDVVSGRVVSGTGAGICQAASTLYNAALLADMPIVERHAHSMRVMYVPPSRDAALMWGSKDFKFRNTMGGALKIQTWVSGGQFHVKLWGEKPRNAESVKIVSRVLSREGVHAAKPTS